MNIKLGSLGLLLLALSKPASVCGQTYYFNNVQTGGGNELPFSDVNNSALQGWSGGGKFAGTASQLYFGAMKGMFVYDPAAATMRMMGSVQVGGATGTVQFNDSRYSGGVLVPATVTVNYTVGNVVNGWMSFDTGVLPLFVGGVNWSWPRVSFEIAGSYVFNTGGQTYTGSFDNHTSFGVPIYLWAGAPPTSDSLTVFSTGSRGNEYGYLLASVTADNGLTLDLSSTDPSDGLTYDNWGIPNFTAVVPEPSVSAILACGLSGLTLWCWRKNRSD